MSSRTTVIAAVLGLVAVAAIAPVAPAQADSLRSAEPFFDVRTGQYVTVEGKPVAGGPSLSMTK